ncbi:carbohydrate esterase [Archangium violaceum]|uniref:alpha/beta hydrolase-fold protein n=1 Tax=Archangium violaceum TaxID=83451 RepID=UPI00194EB5B8|nr:alpha/beta hydrolase-fold protein [Archangium violaceum]QRN97433.1 carbohydrate esterase [Archangium violaceum]
MTHPHPSRSTFLLLLALTALAGCEPKPPTTPTEQTHSDVQFDVTVPPETPVDATLLLVGSDPSFKGSSGKGLELIYQGGTTFSVKARLPKDKELTYTIQMTAPSAQVALDSAGVAVPARTVQVHENEEKVGFEVERWGPEGGATGARTVFIVAVPDITPPDAEVWLSGNQPELGNWNGAGVKLYKAVNNSYATTLTFAAGTSLAFKATRGSWETVEKSAEGREVGDHTFKTGGGFERVSITVGSWADFGSVPPPQVLTGKIEYLKDVTSTLTTLKKRDVIIWLPPGYDANDTTTRYPVLYMHDGQNLMDATTAAYGFEWGVDETAQKLVEEGKVEPLIIVGVYNTSDRGPEYTQVPDPRYPEVDGANGGRADDYGRFLAEELKPMIDKKYHTKTDAQSTGLAGSSLGGLVSMYLGMTRSETFGRLGVVSPSVFWGQKDIITKVKALEQKPALRIWLDIGTEEGGNGQETVADTRELYDALVGEGWVAGSDLKYTEKEGAGHNEASWAARFGDILQYLYPPR